MPNSIALYEAMATFLIIFLMIFRCALALVSDANRSCDYTGQGRL
jgi:hypothetical protein